MVGGSRPITPATVLFPKKETLHHIVSHYTTSTMIKYDQLHTV